MSDKRPTFGEMKAESSGSESSLRCPGCNAVLFVYKTTNGKTVIWRHEACRNPSCKKAFKTRQPRKEIVREIERRRDESSSGQVELRVLRDIA